MTARPWRRDRVRVGGLTFGVSTAPTSGRGTTFVLVHGIGASSRYLDRLGRVLAPHAPVVLVELPGHADLPKPARDVDAGVAAVGEALGAVLDEIGVRRCVLVGHSMGSQWVVELAVVRPGLVAAVVALGPVVDVERRSAVAQLVALALNTLREPPSGNVILLTDYLRCGIPWYLVQLRHMLAYPLESRVAAMAAPLLVVRGQHDLVARLGWARLLRERAARGSLVEIPGRAHAAHHAAPRAVAAAILDHGRRW